MQRLFLLAILLLATAAGADAQWAQTNGPHGASFSALATNDTVLVGSVPGGGIFQYRPASQSWEHVADAQFPNLVYANGVLLGFSYDNWARSIDLGRTWNTIPLGANTVPGTAAVAVGNGAFYAIISDTLYRSIDGAATWTRVGPTPMFARSLVQHGTALFTYGGFASDVLVRSSNGGANWDTLTTNLPIGIGAMGRTLISSHGKLYAAIVGSGIYSSADDGITWAQLGGPSLNNTQIDWVVSNGAEVWAGGPLELFRLNGNGWDSVALPSRPTSPVPTPSGLLLGTVNGIYHVANGSASATPVSETLTATTVDALGVLGGGVLASANENLYRTLDAGTSWEHVGGFGARRFAHSGSTSLALGATLHRSSDDGATWQDLKPEGIEEIIDQYTSVAGNAGALFFSLGSSFGEHGDVHWESGGVFRSTDNGDSWKEVSLGMPNDGFTTVPVTDLLATEDYILASTYVGVYRSVNNGASWAPSNTGLGELDSLKATGSLVRVGNRVYLATYRRLFESYDGGRTWNPLDDPLLDRLPYGLDGSAADGKLYVHGYARTDSGTYVSQTYTYDGRRWKDITAELPAGVDMLTFIDDGRYVYSGSSTHGVWRTSVTSGVAAALSADARASIAPNPATRDVVVRFSLDAPAEVTITVADAAGVMVARQNLGRIDGGDHESVLDVSGLPSGSYAVRTLLGSRVTTSRLVVIH